MHEPPAFECLPMLDLLNRYVLCPQVGGRAPAYMSVAQAIIESALVAWVGLLICAVTQFTDTYNTEVSSSLRSFIC
jgi:hypothetical protein